MKYFEYQLEKQKRVEEREEEEEETEGRQRKGQPEDYLPERKKYERLCRGEGLRMVRREKHSHTHICLTSSVIQLVSAVRLPAGRVASSAVTTTTIATRNT